MLPTPDSDWVEFDVSPNPLRDALLSSPLAPDAGLLAVPDGPGLGVTVDEAALEHFTTETFEVTT